MPSKFKAYPPEYAQSTLLPANVLDRLPEDPDGFVFQEWFQQLDTREVEVTYRPRGQRADPPRQILSILVVAYSHGVYSSRQIEKRCNEDLGFMYIAGKHCPNFRVLSDFRKDHGAFFRDCFQQTVRLAMELEMVSLGPVMDGSKFKANSSKHKAMSYQGRKEREQQLCTEIEALLEQAARCDAEEDQCYRERTGYELPADLRPKEGRLKKIQAAKQALEAREEALHPGEEIADRKPISFADQEARIMQKKGGGVDYAYNPQISVDSDTQVIVGQHVSQQANDQQEVEPALQEIEQTCHQLPERMSLDNGYHSGSNLQSLEDHAVEAYVVTGRSEKTSLETLETSSRKLVKADFHYDGEKDGFDCPGGQFLGRVRVGQQGVRTYQGEASVCAACPFQSRCCQSKQGQARTIHTDGNEPVRRRMAQRMSTSEAKEIYGKRKVIVEPVFGQIKNAGFRGFSVRGKEAVSGEFSLVCTAHNLKKIVKTAMTGFVRPEFGKGALIRA